MVTFLAGGTGTPKLLTGLASSPFDPATTTVIANTGDDVELGGQLVCPDVDTVLYLCGGLLDRETWWGIDDDTTHTHTAVARFREALDLAPDPRYLSADQQTTGRDIAQWRRFSGAAEFMQLGDTDRAIHTIRTGLLDEGHSLTTVTRKLATGLGLSLDLIPMSDDPVASLIHTPTEMMHFQEFWVAHHGEPPVDDVEFRGADTATPTLAVMDALSAPVVIGPSNPVTSIGPMLAMESFRDALAETTVVAVSPFIGEEVFSGPAAKLMRAVGFEPSTAGLVEAYPFLDAVVIDTDDPTTLDCQTIRTNITLETPDDATRVLDVIGKELAIGD